MPAIWTSRQPWVRRPSGLVTLNRGSGLARGLVFFASAPDTSSRARSVIAATGVSTSGVGLYGHGWRFGTNDGLKYGTGWGALVGGGSFTVCAWCRPEAASTRRVLLGDWTNAGTGSSVVMQITTGNTWEFYSAQVAGGASAAATKSGATTTETCVVGRLRAGDTRQIWVDGVEGTPNTLYTPEVRNGDGARTIGGSGDFVGGIGWNGLIYSATFWNRALSDAEVRALYDPRTRWELYQPIVKRSYFDMAGGAPPANVEGTGALTAGSATLSATGTLRVTATASVTATAATLSATGAQRHTATSALTVQAATTAATTTQRNRATSTLTAGAATVTASGSVGSAITGTATLTATAAALAGTAGQTHRATSALSATGATLTASGTVGSAIVGTSVLTAPAATLAGTGAQAHRGTAALTAAPATLSGTGTVASGAVTGSATLTAQAATLSAVTTQTHYATATLTASAATIWASQSPDLAADADTWRARPRPTAWRARPRPTAWRARPRPTAWKAKP